MLAPVKASTLGGKRITLNPRTLAAVVLLLGLSSSALAHCTVTCKAIRAPHGSLGPAATEEPRSATPLNGPNGILDSASRRVYSAIMNRWRDSLALSAVLPTVE